MINVEKFKDMIDNALERVHTIYLAKVISVSDDMAKIQPLSLMTFETLYGEKQAVLSAPIAQNVKKLKVENVVIGGTSYPLAVAEGISKGDIVIVGCGEKDISETRLGYFAIPQDGHHRITDSIIIGVI